MEFRVTGFRVRSTDSAGAEAETVFPVKEELWGAFGPGHTKWANKWVYWVLPKATLFLAVLIWLAFSNSCRSGSESPRASVSPTTMERLASAVEKLAEQKPATTATKQTATPANRPAPTKPATPPAAAPTTAMATTNVAPPTIVINVPEKLKLEVTGLPSPLPQAQAPPEPSPPADPMAGMTPKQRCDYEIIVLRMPRCSP